MKSQTPTHLLRLRQVEDLKYVRPDTADVVVINANFLENNHQSVQDWLSITRLSFLIDPGLWRFQEQSWPTKPDGSIKRNYARLALRYERETSLAMGSSPLNTAGITVGDWEQLASNGIEYQRDRPSEGFSDQLSLLDETGSAPKPAAFVAPYLVSHEEADVQTNRVLHEAAAAAAGQPVWRWVAVDPQQFRERTDDELLSGVSRDTTSGVVLWLPACTDDRLMTDNTILARVISLALTVTSQGIPFILNGGYVAAALTGSGISGLLHPIRWVDNGDPAKEASGGLRSCQIYVPGLHAPMRFKDAARLAQGMTQSEYLRLFCDCFICRGAFENGQHPLDLLLEEQEVPGPRGGTRMTPTGRALLVHTWHFLAARRAEVRRFGERPATEVLGEDFERAVSLAGTAPHLGRLAELIGAA